METSKKLYSVRELYWIFYNGQRTMKHLFRAKKNKELSQEFIERIMLAVTEVNGCSVCSYAHTKMALEAGMTNEEITKMLAGVIDDVPVDEVAGVMFAQYYADSKGNPSVESWQRILELYGKSKAYGILGAIRAIMIGNALGIVWSALFSRLKGKPDSRTSLPYEVVMILVSIVILPVSFIHALISGSLKVPITNF
jgi:AhpD family alkylhydroperoxidase